MESLIRRELFALKKLSESSGDDPIVTAAIEEIVDQFLERLKEAIKEAMETREKREKEEEKKVAVGQESDEENEVKHLQRVLRQYEQVGSDKKTLSLSICCFALVILSCYHRLLLSLFLFLFFLLFFCFILYFSILFASFRFLEVVAYTFSLSLMYKPSTASRIVRDSVVMLMACNARSGRS